MARRELGLFRGAAISGTTLVELVFGDFDDPCDFRRDKNGVASRRVGNRDFNIGPHKILLAAPETESTFGHIFAGDDVVGEARPPDAGFIIDPGTRVFAAVVKW